MIRYFGEQLVLVALDTPAAPTLTKFGTGGAATYSYQVVARRSTGHTEASEEVSVTDGPTTLSATHAIDVKPHYVQGAESFDIYRTAGGASSGKIGNIAARNSGTTQVASFRDRGQTGDDASPPDTNTTGTLALDALSEGSLLMVGTDGVLMEVSAGTEGQVLTMVSGTPTWVTQGA